MLATSNTGLFLADLVGVDSMTNGSDLILLYKIIFCQYILLYMYKN